MTWVQKEIEVSSMHILDLNFESKCLRCHGHNYLFVGKVRGPLDANGMVIDYGVLKKHMKAILDDWDHKFIVPEGYVNQGDDEDRVVVVYPQREFNLPVDDVAILPIEQTTCEQMAEYFHEQLSTLLPNYEVAVEVHETSTTKVEYP